MPVTSLTTVTQSRLKILLLTLSTLFTIYLLFPNFHHPPLPPPPPLLVSPTTRRHVIFSIASFSRSWPRRKPYLRLWYDPNTTRAFAFLDRLPPDYSQYDHSLPPVIISCDTSRFPYTFHGGLRSAIRLARIVKEVVDLNEQDVRWFVFGDDDTVFFVDNLVNTLAKYDHDRWFYIGSNSESYEQNVKYSFDMAFGGGGFAISHSLAKVLSRVLDSCLMRYGHLYGSDARIFSCLAELGVGLTHEPGFHQVDIRGNLFGMLSAHPLSPIVSLHHLDATEPIFPNMNKTQGLNRISEAANVDSSRVFQTTVCYDNSISVTISVSWGYAIQVIEGNQLLPELLPAQRTFMPWRRMTSRVDSTQYMFNTRDYPKDPCKRPILFFLESVMSDRMGVWSNYTRHTTGECPRSGATKNLEQIRVFSQKLELDVEEMKAPRRQCCDIVRSLNQLMLINIRKCGVDELISMHI